MHIHCLAQTDYPAAAEALLDNVAESASPQFPMQSLSEAAAVVRAKIDETVEASEEVAGVVSALERQYDAFVAAQENRSLLARDEGPASGEELGAGSSASWPNRPTTSKSRRRRELTPPAYCRVMGIDVTVLRVFTDADGQFGNPLGVVDAATVPHAGRQAVATALGYSETIFIDLPGNGSTTAHGHLHPVTELRVRRPPTVGAAWWLRQRGTPSTPCGFPPASCGSAMTTSRPLSSPRSGGAGVRHPSAGLRQISSRQAGTAQKTPSITCGHGSTKGQVGCARGCSR